MSTGIDGLRRPMLAVVAALLLPACGGSSSDPVVVPPVDPGPLILSTHDLQFTALVAGPNPSAQDVGISKSASAVDPIRWTAESDRPWLQAAPYSGTTPTGPDPVSVSAIKSQAEAWTTDTTGTGAAAAREDFALAWTGSEMLIWGGTTNGGHTADGRRYNPATDTWTGTLSTVGAPSARRGATAVWTGSEMIVWGGYSTMPLNDGYRYNPRTDTWSGPIAATALPGRGAHSAVWTGTEMIVWGGSVAGGSDNTGARYNPATDTWRSMATSGLASTREHHVAVWTGTEMILWGGQTGTTRLNTGARYDPVTDLWTGATPTAGAPPGSGAACAVWTGTEMIVWGGITATSAATNGGGRYDPLSNTWTGATTLTNAPVGRRSLEAVWVNGEMILWGGYDGGGYHSEGRRYHPPIALGVGTYTGTLRFLDPAAANSPQLVTVQLNVLP